jgi:hypothetical protein
VSVTEEGDIAPSTRNGSDDSSCVLIIEESWTYTCLVHNGEIDYSTCQFREYNVLNTYIECPPGDGPGSPPSDDEPDDDDDPNGGPLPLNPEQEYQATVNSLVLVLLNAIADLIANVGDNLSIDFVSSLSNGDLAAFALYLSDIFDPTKPLVLQISMGLTETQLKLILAHEILGHLTLFDIMREAGSTQALYGINQQLLNLLNQHGIK